MYNKTYMVFKIVHTYLQYNVNIMYVGTYVCTFLRLKKSNPPYCLLWQVRQTSLIHPISTQCVSIKLVTIITYQCRREGFQD